MGRVVGFAALLAILACSGCAALGLWEPEPTSQTQVAEEATQPSATFVRSATPTEGAAQASPTEVGGGETVEAGPCELIAVEQVTVYERPSTTAALFGTTETGFRVQPEARTADGWWGFDPGVAQAANVGVFRLRWVQESALIHLEGSCGEVPEVVAPPPGVCFTMPMEDVLVLANPDPSAEVKATLSLGDYAAVVGRGDSWAMLDLSVGNTAQDVVGWIPAATLNMNGPCDSLPAVEP